MRAARDGANKVSPVPAIPGLAAACPTGVRFLVFQKESALVMWYRRPTADVARRTRMAMIVALARKLIIALWRMATTGEVPEGLRLRTAVPVGAQ